MGFPVGNAKVHIGQFNTNLEKMKIRSILREIRLNRQSFMMNTKLNRLRYGVSLCGASIISLVVMGTLHSCKPSQESQASDGQGGEGWEERLAEELPKYGHRNWIVIADAAYPKQSAPGIETIYTGGKQIDVLKKVLKAVEGMPHVYAAVQVDHELDSISEKDAPGITAYRDELKKLLERQTVEVKPHEEIISQLDEGSKLFNVLLLKTDMTLPYTSVFLRLECGYWTPEAEARLRETLAK